MECDIDTLREFLATAGCPVDAAASLLSGEALGDQGVLPELRSALSHVLTEALGVPGAPQTLVETGSLDDWSGFVARHLNDETIRNAAVARIRARAGALPAQRAYSFDRLSPEDAPGVAQLFYTIYDANYPVVDYYVPEKLAALNKRNAVVTLVARLETGEIAGQAAYYHSSPPNPAVYEQGQLLVDPVYRRSSMAFRLLKELDDFSRSMTWAEAFFGEAVCNHLVTQKSGERQGYVPCGIELSLMPSGAYSKEGASGRVSCMVGFRVDRDHPLTLHLPECYRPALEDILSGFSLRRDLRFSANDVPEARETVLTSRIFDLSQVERVQVLTIGQDFPDHVAALVEQAERLGLAVVQVNCNAASPGTNFAVKTLRERGFIFGSFAPLWFDGGDAIMLQRLSTSPDFGAINLLTDRAKNILGHIRAEWDVRKLG